MKPSTIQTVSVVVGAVLVSVGVSEIYRPAGLIVGGLLMLTAGLAGHLRGRA